MSFRSHSNHRDCFLRRNDPMKNKSRGVTKQNVSLRGTKQSRSAGKK
ncbi:MAG: hypothetical protein L6Q81_06005 [Bacteroidia bacterium]|nr:hypothetical protein [Bacteroidia bacterium]